MRLLSLLLGVLLLLAGCAGTAGPKADYQAFCRTHATNVTLEGSPDVEGEYRDCLNEEGMHQIEVSKTK